MEKEKLSLQCFDIEANVLAVQSHYKSIRAFIRGESELSECNNIAVVDNKEKGMEAIGGRTMDNTNKMKTMTDLCGTDTSFLSRSSNKSSSSTVENRRNSNSNDEDSEGKAMDIDQTASSCNTSISRSSTTTTTTSIKRIIANGEAESIPIWLLRAFNVNPLLLREDDDTVCDNNNKGTRSKGRKKRYGITSAI